MTAWAARKVGQSRGLRRGSVFPVRLTSDERAELERCRDECAGPEGLGPWMAWAARRAFAATGVLPRRRQAVVPVQALEPVIPELVPPAAVIPARARMVLDLCGGSGSWSRCYQEAGYDVRVLTLPDVDVRAYEPPRGVWGILAAPPCDQFSLARNGHDSPRDFLGALEVVTACLRIVALAKPQWWALENPVGLLGRWLGTPRDVFEPYEFGDAWTKRTALWGEFRVPARGPFVQATGSAMQRSTAAARAVTPPGFARAFYEANP